jgi:flagellar biosynthesis/type III secretory pathway chaperone
MEKNARKIEELLEEKLFLYQELQSILEQEKRYIVKMDVDSLWVTVSQKKSLILRIEDARQKIIHLLGKESLGPDKDTQSFSMTSVIKWMAVSSEKKAELEKIYLAVNTCKKEITRLASDNKNYIHESLSIIDSVFSTVLEDAEKKGYTPSGTALHNNGKNRLIHAQV